MRPVDPAGRADPAAASDLLDTPQAGPAAIRGGFLRIAGYGGGIALSVGAAALLLRHLGVEDSGGYVAVLALAAVVMGLTDLGLATLGVRELTVRSGEQRSEVMRTLLGLRVVLTLMGTLAVVAFAVVAGYTPTLVAGTAIAGAGVVLQGVQTQLATSLQTRMRLGAMTAIELGRQAISTLLIVVGVLVGAGLLSFVAVTVVAGLLTAAVTALLVRHDVPLRPSFDITASRALMREIGIYSAAAAAYVLYFRAAIIIVSVIGTARELGTFAAAYRVVDVVMVLPTLAVGGAFPILARAARDDAARFAYVVSRLFDAALVFGVWLALMLGLGAPLVIAVVAGADFTASVSVLRIQSAVVATAFVGAVWGFALLALGLYRAALYISLATLAVGFTLIAVLTATHGPTGAAAGTVLGELLVVLLGAAALARHDRSVLPAFRSVPRVAIAAAAAIAPAVLLELPAGAAMAVGSAIYIPLVLAFGAVPREMLDELRRGRVIAPSPPAAPGQV